METKTLDQEKFNSLKALADIQSEISAGRVNLVKIKDDTKAYLVVRETEAQDRVTRVFKESVETLEEVSKNHTEIVTYKNELNAYAKELEDTSSELGVFFSDFSDRMNIAGEIMEVNRKNILEVLSNVRLERVQVREDRKLLKIERERTSEGMKLLKDQRGLLNRGFEELKKLKDKK